MLIVNKAREAAACAEANCASSFTNATNAANSATAAAASETNVENIWEDFQDRYMGPFASPPVAPGEGSMYYNTVSNVLFVWNGSAWVSADFNEFTNFTATGTTSARNLVTRTSEYVNVKDFGAIGNGVADDRPAFILAANAATAASKNLLIPDGTYYLAGGGLIPIGDVYIACYGELTGPGAVFTSNGGCPFGIGNFYWNTFGKNQNILQFDTWNVNATDVDTHSTINAVRRYDGVSNTNAYYASGTPLYGYLHYGEARASQANKASGSANAIAGRINVFSLDNGTSGIGRSEMVAAAGAVSCSPTASITAAGNYYNEFSINGPTGTNSSDPQREAYMAGATFLVQKYCPGNTKDANHEGSYGVSICTRPGAGGFDFPRPSNVENYKLFAGLAITGWTGVSGVAANGNSPSANSAYDWGIIVGGHGSVWTSFNTQSKIDNGIGIRDYVYDGIRIFNKHPNADASSNAIAVYPDAGVSLFGLSAQLDSEARIQTAISSQYGSAIRIGPSTHVTSERAGIQLGNWIAGQDSAGNGTKDFALWDGSRNVFKSDPSGTDPIWVYVNGTLKQVTEGAADSGGVGYKVLRVVN